MISEELSPSGDNIVTPLDLARMESLEIGESMNAESGAFSVIRYRKDYTLLMGSAAPKDFDTVYQIVGYLQTIKQ